MATLRPDIPIYETDGNLEPIRHPEAQQSDKPYFSNYLNLIEKKQEEHRRLIDLWRAAWIWAPVINSDSSIWEIKLVEAINALGPPPA